MSRNKRVFLLLAVALLLAVLGNLCLGASGIDPAEVLRAITSGETDSAAARIFWYVRLPRTIAALLAGAALASAGLLLQSVLRNPLAAPSVIGVNSGAGLGALICMALLPEMVSFVPFVAFLGACGAAFLVYLLARCAGSSRTTIILSGVAVNAIFGAVMDAIVTLVPDALSGRSAFSIGGFGSVSMKQLEFAAPMFLLAFLGALLFRREMSVLSLGDDVARSLGLRVEYFRMFFIVAAAMLAGAAVSFAGLLGFVGLVAPHMARFLMKDDSPARLPFTAMLGSLLCLLCDLLARLLFAPYELPVGIVLSCLGAPFFLYLLLVHKKRSRHSAG